MPLEQRVPRLSEACLGALCAAVADNGLGVVLISHNMVDVMQVADNIACLYLGSMAAQAAVIWRIRGDRVSALAAIGGIDSALGKNRRIHPHSSNTISAHARH